MRAVWRISLLLVISGLCLQAYFLARIALMNVLDPQSTTFQRSEFSRILRTEGEVHWRQRRVPSEHISDNLRRAVIASEDANFVDHNGVEWDAIENAWKKNTAAQARAEKKRAEAMARHQRAVERAKRRGRPEPAAPDVSQVTAKVIGGSTITQQLAKNLFLSSERNILRKGQEFAITFMLEALLSKDRILDIYLNNVEWGEGVFGAQAASHHHFGVDASSLARIQAARLAVMLPAPKRFEQSPRSPYLNARAATIAARMGSVELP